MAVQFVRPNSPIESEHSLYIEIIDWQRRTNMQQLLLLLLLATIS